MTSPRIQPEVAPDRDGQGDQCSPGARIARMLGLTLLGAAITIPAVCYYVSRRLRRAGRAASRHRAHASATADGPTRITIPIEIVGRDEATEDIAPPEEEMQSDADQPASAVDAIAGRTEAAPFVGSTESDKFHVPGCRWARNIDADHRLSFPNRESALAQGYMACSTCRP